MDPKIQKIKLLKMWEILHRKTDDLKPITTQEILEELSNLNIKADRHTIYSDIDTMIQWGYEVKREKRGKDMCYWVEKREFDIPEVKLIMDAVEASKFIPQDKTDELLNKIADLGGSARGQLLKRSARNFNTVKHSNSDIYKIIDVLERAIERRRKVKFRYFDLNANKERIYRHDKQIYMEEPLALIINDGNYYLICYRPEPEYTDHVKIFRLDRMSDVIETVEDISPNATSSAELIQDYPKQVFKMYGGETSSVTLGFDENMIGVIFNKFGEDTVIRNIEGKYVADVTVQLSPTFWGWLTQFPGQMKIIAPDKVRQQYIAFTKSAIEQYDEEDVP